MHIPKGQMLETYVDETPWKEAFDGNTGGMFQKKSDVTKSSFAAIRKNTLAFGVI